ncbi:MAG: putative Ig domain-containing protein, partial [Arenimonas sp.]
ATSVTESARQVLKTDWQTQLTSSSANSLSSAGLYRTVSPHSTTEYDAFGNAIRYVRYANGMQSGVVTADALNDQTTVQRYDRQGRLVMERDAQGVERYREYDAADHATKLWYRLDTGSGSRWRVVANFSYDGNGQQLTTSVTRQLEIANVLQAGTLVTDTAAAVKYNAFGEITAQAAALADLGDAGKSRQSQYDSAGRLVRSSEGSGIFRDYGYNLAGQQLSEIHQVYTTGPGTTTVTTINTLDKLGRTTRQTLPGYSATPVVSYVSRRYDRWGNVVEIIDPNGNNTRYEYNELNNAVREIQPLVKVVSETGMEIWVRPEQRWYFDARGQQVGMRDANGNVHQTSYDAHGRVSSNRDALGSVSRQAYDAFGRVVAKQNPLGYITYESFDRLDRTISQGDFLLNDAGTARAQKTIQGFLLNQNGQRIQVTDGNSFASKYDYDSRDMLLRSQSAAGSVQTYAYDTQGKKIRETTGIYNAGSAAIVDRDGDSVRFDEQSWKYDYFGRMVDYNDLGRNDFNYTYNTTTGQLLSYSSTRSAAATDRSQTYYANGMVRQLTDSSGDYTLYEYDANGNRTLEESHYRDGRNTAMITRTRTYYDSHNRIERVTSDDVGSNVRTLDVRYDYDAVGNRRRVVTQTQYNWDGTILAMDTSAPTPVATAAPAPIGLPAGQARSFRLQASELFRDADRSNLTYSATLADGSILPTWLTMGTDSNRGQLVFDVTAGSSAANGTIVKVKVIATEAGGAQATTIVSLIVGANNAPVLKSASVPVIKLMTDAVWGQSFRVSDYFTDYDLGDQLTFSLDSASPAASWLIATNPSSDVVSLSAKPTLAQAGTYTLRLMAKDRDGVASFQTVQLVVEAPAAPVVAGVVLPKTIYIGRGFEFERAVSSLFTDANSDVLQITAALSSGGTLPTWMNFVLDRTSANPTIRLSGAVPWDAVQGQSYQVRFTATDPSGLSANTVVTFNVMTHGANSSPVVNSNVTLPPMVWTSNQANVSSYSPDLFIDPDGDTLSISVALAVYHEAVESGDPRGQDYTYTPAYYSYEAAPAWVTVDAVTRTIRATPTNDYLGVQSFVLMANDPSGYSETVAWLDLTIVQGSPPAVVNQAPIQAVFLPDQRIARNQPWSFLLPPGAFKDPEAGALTFSATLSNGAALPSWLNFNPATGLFKGSSAAAGNWAVKVLVTDPAGNSISTVFNLEVSANAYVAPASVATDPLNALNSPNVTQVASTLPGGPTPMAYWFTYDAESRVQVVNGTLINGRVQIGGDIGLSYELRYDEAGNAVAKISYNYNNGQAVEVQRSIYTQRGQLATVLQGSRFDLTAQEGTVPWRSMPVEKRFYDDGGRLVQVQQFYPNGSYGFTSGYTIETGGWLKHATVYVYNNDGRVTQQTEYGRQNADWMAPIFQGGINAVTQATQSTQINVLSTLSSNVMSYDLAGNLTGRTNYNYLWEEYRGQAGISPSFIQYFTNTYLKRSSYLESGVAGSSNKPNFKPASTASTYDVLDRLMSVVETSPAAGFQPVHRYFGYDAEGHILVRRDGKWINNQFNQGSYMAEIKRNNKHFTYSNGQQIGQVDEIGKVEALAGLTAFDSGASGTARVSVQFGDTLESLAQRVYGNSTLWYVLASANALNSNEDLVVGSSLKVPDVKTTKNDSATFKPYNPAEIVGDTTPTLPYIAPPPKASCGQVLLQIVMVVIAVVVTIYTAGAMSGFASTALGTALGTVGSAMVVGAVAGAAGAAASMAFGSMTGVASFSWRGVAAGAVTGAITGGLGAKFGSVADAIKGGSYAKAAGLAVSNQLAGYAGNKIAGVEGTSFSWKAIAAGSVGNLASAAAGHAFGFDKAPSQGLQKFGQEFATGMVGGVVTAHARKAFGLDERVNYGQIARDAFGNALGSALGVEVKEFTDRQSALKALTPAQMTRYEEMVRNGIPKNDAAKYASQTAGPLPDYLYRKSALDEVRERMSSAMNATDFRSAVDSSLGYFDGRADVIDRMVADYENGTLPAA